MNKVKLLSIIAIVFLALNIFLMWTIFSNKQPRNGRGKPKEMIIKKLQFDAQQQVAYEKCINQHRTTIKEKELQSSLLKNKLYNGLINTNSTNLKDSLINEIGKIQVDIEHTHYKHFEDIKSLCKPNQLLLFEALTSEISNLFSNRRQSPNER